MAVLRRSSENQPPELGVECGVLCQELATLFFVERADLNDVLRGSVLPIHTIRSVLYLRVQAFSGVCVRACVFVCVCVCVCCCFFRPQCPVLKRKIVVCSRLSDVLMRSFCG